MEFEPDERTIARRRRAFFWILGVFIAFLVFALFLTFMSFLLAQRENARRERCDMNLSRLYAATVEYSDANGTYPPAFTVDKEGARLHSWRVALLPYLGEEELYSQIRLNEPWDSEWNRQFWSKTPNVYRCASTPVDEKASPEENDKRCAYSCIVGKDTAFPEDGTPVSPNALVDGTANTILYVERKKPVNWMDPNSEITFEQALEENTKPAKERENFGSWHGKGAFVVLCDGNRRFLSDKIENSVLSLLLCVDDSHDDEKLGAAQPSADEPQNAPADEKTPSENESL